MGLQADLGLRCALSLQNAREHWIYHTPLSQRTAVLDLYRHIKKNGHEDRQIAFYHNGMGTVPALPSWRSFEYWKQILNSRIDLAIGW